MFYLKTLHIGNQHNLGSCILDVLLSDRDYIGAVSIFKRFSACVTNWHVHDLRAIKANSIN